MRHSVRAVLLVAFVCAGCGRQKSTDELVAAAKSQDEKDRVVAVRLLGQQKKDATRTIPALIQALNDHDGDIRRSAAIGLGNFGAEARQAVPALQAVLKDRDARVRESAAVALSRIDPTTFSTPARSVKGG